MDNTRLIELGLINVCRACLSDKGDMKSVFSRNKDIELLEMYNCCTSLQISGSDGLPELICVKCILKLSNAYEFRLQCQRSYETLMKYIENGLSIENKTNLVYDEHNYDTSECVKFEDLPEINQTNINCETESSSRSDNESTEESDFTCQKETNKIQKIQFSPDIVNQAIIDSKKKHSEKRQCRLCGFISSNGRGLTLHIAHLHKELKDKWCSYCFEEVDSLTEHMKSHSKNRNYICTFCDKGFSSQGHLTEHIKSHSIARPFKCNDCGKAFLFARHLRVHKRIHSGEKPYSCSYCERRFTQKGSLQGHMRTHTGLKPFECKDCDKKCTTSSALAIHRARTGHASASALQKDNKTKECAADGQVAIDAPPAQDAKKRDDVSEDEFDDAKIEWIEEHCETCNKNVKNLPAHLKIHKLYLDNDGGSERSSVKKLCTVCGKTFNTASKLRVHTRIHTGEAPYVCTYCERRFRTRGQLVVHVRTHTGERPHVCSYCGKGFAQSSVLNTHMKLHTGRPEECQICHQKFCRPAELRLHMRKHTGEKPYLCTACGQAFIQRSHLMEHVKIHTDERPYKCDVCGRGFKQSSSLKSHVHIHTGHKPYKCPHCPYACRQSYSLTQHVRQHLQPLRAPPPAVAQ